MKVHVLLPVCFIFLILSTTSYADPLDLASSEALQKTQSMLTNPEERQKAMQGDAKAQETDAKVRALAGSEANTNEIYGLSSDIMNNIFKESNGDADKMQKMIEEAKNNPAGFAEKLSPEQKARLKAISERTPATNIKP